MKFISSAVGQLSRLRSIWNRALSPGPGLISSPPRLPADSSTSPSRIAWPSLWMTNCRAGSTFISIGNARKSGPLLLIGRSLIRSTPRSASSTPSCATVCESSGTVCHRSSSRENGRAPATQTMRSVPRPASPSALRSKKRRIVTQLYVLQRSPSRSRREHTCNQTPSSSVILLEPLNPALT